MELSQNEIAIRFLESKFLRLLCFHNDYVFMYVYIYLFIYLLKAGPFTSTNLTQTGLPGIQYKTCTLYQRKT